VAASAPALRRGPNVLNDMVDWMLAQKYVNPPTTTEYAILFFPTEGLYAEVLRRRGWVEALFEKHRVFVCGPL
jgi:DNA anti-recombination protein RmuC